MVIAGIAARFRPVFMHIRWSYWRFSYQDGSRFHRAGQILFFYILFFFSSFERVGGSLIVESIASGGLHLFPCVES